MKKEGAVTLWIIVSGLLVAAALLIARPVGAIVLTAVLLGLIFLTLIAGIEEE